eukprot:2023108-Amphidinium_carterae.2
MAGLHRLALRLVMSSSETLPQRGQHKLYQCVKSVHKVRWQAPELAMMTMALAQLEGELPES